MLANQNQGPVLRHLSLQFPTDSYTYNELIQFMVGDGLMVLPVVEQGTLAFVAYIPAGAWYHFYSGVFYNLPNIQNVGQYIVFDVPDDYGTLPLLARGGTVIPFHPTPAMTVTATKASGIGLKVFFDFNQSAFGHVQIATDAPLDSQNVTVVNYVADGTLANGAFVSLSATAPKINPALTARVPIELFFPTCVDLAVNATVKITIDGVVDESGEWISNFTCKKFTYLLPLGKDGSTAFILLWSVPTITPIETPTSSDHTGAIVGGVVGGAAGAALISVAVYFLKFRHGGSSEYNEIPMRQEV
ncbi:lysosomal alpha-glucosidase-like, putative [Bodo saltans]|uniref:Lysosomal alpha-glucosidase-like, putative n=1 Tax=Bodo saltans TaxID=75058 RepID=A0A0S4JLI6_BODSA|nr:lysosomal alpha-glucosidase-like, putative [Bodo saltans]|eukprot:CUG90123.1 lysosomal alpha-glucosidase-like, putative [Bodo saltans]